jgi:type I restriction enzyme M protein
MANLSAIVWLYRGQEDRFLKLVRDYLKATWGEVKKVSSALSGFECAFSSVDEVFANVRMEIEEGATQVTGGSEFLAAADELSETYQAYSTDRGELESGIAKFRKKYGDADLATNAKQHAARQAFDPIAERLRGMVKQVDLIVKIAGRAGDLARDWLKAREKALDDLQDHFIFDRRRLGRLLKELDAARKEAVDQLRNATYFHRQAAWLQDRFPEARLADVPGLVKLVSRADIKAADWSLTPGRYVGVAPAEGDADFDFEQTMHDIHMELTELNQEATELVANIQRNFQDLGL